MAGAEVEEMKYSCLTFLLVFLLLGSQSWAEEKKPLEVTGVFNPNIGVDGGRGTPDRNIRGYLTLKNLTASRIKNVDIIARYLGLEDTVYHTEELNAKVDSKDTTTVNLYWPNPGGQLVNHMDFTIKYNSGGEAYEDYLKLEMKEYDPLKNPTGY